MDAICPRQIDKPRAPMRGQFLYVEDLEAVPGGHHVDRGEREIGEMLMIDRVELVFVDEPLDVREFKGDHPLRLEQERHACHEVVEVWNLCENIVADDEIGLLAFLDKLARQADTEEVDTRRHALGDCSLRDVRRWLDAEGRNAERLK